MTELHQRIADALAASGATLLVIDAVYDALAADSDLDRRQFERWIAMRRAQQARDMPAAPTTLPDPQPQRRREEAWDW